MKVVIAADIYPPDIGGPATYASFLLEQLPKQGVEVKVICYSNQAGDDVIRLVRSGNVLLRYLKYFWQLKKIAKTADVIYAMGPVSAGWPASWVAKLLKKPLIVKVVGDYAWEQARNSNKTQLLLDDFQKHKFRGKIQWLRIIEKRVCQKASKVVVPSWYLKKIVSGWDINEQKIEVIYNAATVNTKAPVKKGTTIVSVGRLVPWKGFETLIALMVDFRSTNPELNLEIYGSGPDKEKLQAQIKKFNLSDTVSIKSVPHDELAARIANARMLVLNTGYEGFAHTILEAMAAGTPVVTTTVGGNPEIITDGHNGLLVGYNDQGALKAAILRLLRDKKLYLSIVENGIQTLLQFSEETMLKKTIGLLKRV